MFKLYVISRKLRFALRRSQLNISDAVSADSAGELRGPRVELDDGLERKDGDTMHW